MAKKPVKQRVSRVTIPDHAHPLARLVFRLMAENAITYDELSWRSGVLVCTIKAWRKSNTPGLSTISAALGTFGWNIVPVPPREQIPPEILAEIDRLAEQWGDENAVLCQIMAKIAQLPQEPVVVHPPAGPRPWAKRGGRKRVESENNVILFDSMGVDRDAA